jgi:hypothetical protein
MAELNHSNPHIADEYSPLETLIQTAITQFGDFTPSPADGHLANMLINFANQIVETVRQHPYHNGNQIDYYQSIQDRREIPDPIMIAGILGMYSVQQNSIKAQMLMPMYYSTLNSVLWSRFNGNTKIQMRVMDGGTNNRNINHATTNEKNGGVTR